MFIIMALLGLSIWFVLKNTHTDANNPLMGPYMKDVIGGTGIVVSIMMILSLLYYLKTKT